MATAPETKKNESGLLDTLFEVGAHFGLVRSRRHPSARPYIFGQKNKVEIFDLEKTATALSRASDFLTKVASEGGLVLFVGGKNEARESIADAATRINMPFVAGRWLGGTLTNFPEIKKRIAKLEDLTSQKEKGELAKYTKLERLMIDREIERLNYSFSGLLPMRTLPKAVFVIDSKREAIAVAEAKRLKIPVVALASSDCDMRGVEFSIPANDSSAASISHFVQEMARAVQKGQQMVGKNSEEAK
jgi:small subunit ribosomal protein S2